LRPRDFKTQRMTTWREPESRFPIRWPGSQAGCPTARAVQRPTVAANWAGECQQCLSLPPARRRTRRRRTSSVEPLSVSPDSNKTHSTLLRPRTASGDPDRDAIVNCEERCDINAGPYSRDDIISSRTRRMGSRPHHRMRVWALADVAPGSGRRASRSTCAIPVDEHKNVVARGYGAGDQSGRVRVSVNCENMMLKLMLVRSSELEFAGTECCK
jgi:hypothetical protein